MRDWHALLAEHGPQRGYYDDEANYLRAINAQLCGACHRLAPTTTRGEGFGTRALCGYCAAERDARAAVRDVVLA